MKIENPAIVGGARFFRLIRLYRWDNLAIRTGDVMGAQEHSDALAVAKTLAFWGFLTEEELHERMADAGRRFSVQSLSRVLASNDFFVPTLPRWSIRGETPQTILEPFLWGLGDAEPGSVQDLKARVVRALSASPGVTVEEIHAAVGGSHFSLSEVEHVLQSSEIFHAGPTLWFADSASYQAWLKELWQQRHADESVSSKLRNPGAHEVSSDHSQSDDDLELYAGPPPREWQRRALDEWIEAGETGIVEAVTGTGKTVVGILAAARAMYYGEKVVICVPTLVLLRQWVEKLNEFLPDVRVGELHGARKDSIEGVDILVSTAQSALNYVTIDQKHSTILIADEVHGVGAPTRQAILDPHYSSKLGLTATLERDNDEGVEEFIVPYFESTVFTYTYPDGLADGVLAPFKIGFFGVDFLPSEQQEYDELGSEMSRLRWRLEERGLKARSDKELFGKIALLSKDKSADFQDMRLAQKFMSNLSQRKGLQASARNKIEAIEKLAHPLSFSTRGLVFTETIDSATSIARLLNGVNVNAHSFDSQLTSDERQAVLDQYAEGHYQVLCAPRVLDEGVDVPDADVGVIVAASRSRRQMIQRMGRIVRPNRGGHPSTFFIMYLKGTREDPKMGAHEGFLSEVEPYATEVSYFDLRASGPDITAWMYSDR